MALCRLSISSFGRHETPACTEHALCRKGREGVRDQGSDRMAHNPRPWSGREDPSRRGIYKGRRHQDHQTPGPHRSRNRTVSTRKIMKRKTKKEFDEASKYCGHNAPLGVDEEIKASIKECHSHSTSLAAAAKFMGIDLNAIRNGKANIELLTIDGKRIPGK
jgi:hypothetical protein